MSSGLSLNLLGIVLVLLSVTGVFLGKYLSKTALIIVSVLLVGIFTLPVGYLSAFISCFYNCPEADPKGFVNLFSPVLFGSVGIILGIILGKIWKKNTKK